MDVRTFAEELLNSLAKIPYIANVSLETEHLVVRGYAYTHIEGLFLRFYFNEISGTIAFALIEKNQRIWGIDYDNRRGWHLHPEENPTRHVDISQLAISEIISRLHEVLRKKLNIAS